MASNIQWTSEIPPDLIRFLFVALFSLLIGLEQREHHKDVKDSLFGTDRTFALIGILGFILYVISPKNLTPFFIGGVGISLFLGIYYHNKIRLDKKFGITSIVIALITYCLAPLIYSQPIWMSLLVGVSVLSFIVGVTDIDPYILNLFQGVNAVISLDHIIRATMIATASNNLIKMVYAICLGTGSMRRKVIPGFSILIVSSLVLTYYFY